MLAILEKLLLLFLSLFFASITIAQKNWTGIDTLIESTYKNNNKCRMIVKGTRRTGTAYFYLKKNGKTLYIKSRRQFKTGEKLDSSAVYAYYFINDSLVKVSYYRHFSNSGIPISGYTFLYFRKDSIIERSEDGDAPIPNIDLIIREAYAHLKHSYKIDKRHRYRKSTHLNFS